MNILKMSFEIGGYHLLFLLDVTKYTTQKNDLGIGFF